MESEDARAEATFDDAVEAQDDDEEEEEEEEVEEIVVGGPPDLSALQRRENSPGNFRTRKKRKRKRSREGKLWRRRWS